MDGAYGGTGPLVLGVTWTLFTITTGLIIARCISARVNAQRKLRWDLIWAVAAYIVALATQIVTTIAILEGIGVHVYNETLQQFARGFFYTLVAIAASVWSITLGKVAVIALLLQLQGPNDKYKAYFLHFIWISNVLLQIIETIFIFVECSPAESSWDLWVRGNCSLRPAAVKIGYAVASWAAASDLALALYPALIFRNLQMSLRKKIGLSVLMGLGVTATIASAIKTYRLSVAWRTIDLSYQAAQFLIWNQVEVCLVIALGCIPALRPLFARFFKHASQTLNASKLRTSMMGGTSRHGTVEQTGSHTLDNSSLEKKPDAIVSSAVPSKSDEQLEAAAMV